MSDIYLAILIKFIQNLELCSPVVFGHNTLPT